MHKTHDDMESSPLTGPANVACHLPFMCCCLTLTFAFASAAISASTPSAPAPLLPPDLLLAAFLPLALALLPVTFTSFSSLKGVLAPVLVLGPPSVAAGVLLPAGMQQDNSRIKDMDTKLTRLQFTPHRAQLHTS